MNEHLSVPSTYPRRPHSDSLAASRQRSATNLLLQLTSFIGREQQIAEVKQLLLTTRLLTLVGPGGVGKTRLALQIAEQLLSQFAEGVWLVDLAPLTETQSIPQAIALTLQLQLRQEAKRAPLTAIVEALQWRQMLLILDNCEHVIDACIQVAATLLAACPALTLLATSREAFGMGGELIWRVPSLTVPPALYESQSFSQRIDSPEQLQQYEATQLFLQRAQSVRPTFSLTPHNAPVIAHICQQLDGIPLAIELAAARVQVLSVEQITARLDQSFHLLTSGSRAALPRQQTLRATLDWSHHLLSQRERIFFRRLSVLVSAWTIENTEIVCRGGSDEDLVAHEVLDCLMQLVNKSLVIMEERGSQACYRLLEVVRQYGREKLEQVGEEEQIRRRHLEHFLTLTYAVERQPAGKNLVTWLQRIELAYDNLRSALEWALNEGLGEQALRLAAGLWLYWYRRNLVVEGSQWLEMVLSHTAQIGSTMPKAAALFASGSLMTLIPDFSRAQQRLEESLAIWHEVHHFHGVALAQTALARNALGLHQFDVARAWLKESIPVLEQVGDQQKALVASGILALIFFEQGEYTLARQQMLHNVERARDLNDPWLLARTLTHLEELTRFEGDKTQAELLAQEALQYFQELETTNGCAMTIGNLAQIALARGDAQQALGLQLEAAHLLLHHLGGHEYICGMLICLAAIALALHEPLLAARLFGAVETLREEYSVPLHVLEQTLFERTLATLTALIDPDQLACALSEGRHLSPGQAVKLIESFQSALAAEPPAAWGASSSPIVQALTENDIDLTPREIEVLRLVTQGLTNKQIAEVLVISPKTVSRHIESIFSKLSVTSRSAATRFALEHHLF